MNINSSPPSASPEFDSPPPIPPKSSSQVNDGSSGSHQRNDSGVSVDRVAAPENYSIPKLQLDKHMDNDESNC